jgi:hypothetical protein
MSRTISPQSDPYPGCSSLSAGRGESRFVGPNLDLLTACGPDRGGAVPWRRSAPSRASVVRLLAQYAIQPSPGAVPIALDTNGSDPQKFRGFLYAQPSEIAQLRDTGPPGIDLSQRLQCVVQGRTRACWLRCMPRGPELQPNHSEILNLRKTEPLMLKRRGPLRMLRPTLPMAPF